ncbi:MAG: PKD domain-containing protein, partial [Anaerolineae bacterium]|nr:PKD domain-containing protein [Anaerolineae bacterium]
WSWDFGDGGTSALQHPTHTYTTPGSYTVTLTVTDTETGQTDTLVRANYVTVIEPVALVAGFTATPTSGTAPLEVTFTDTSTPAEAADVWSWDFGDGGTSALQHPTHTYTTPGTYMVTLTVTATNTGESTSATQTITVQEPLPEPLTGVAVQGATVGAVNTPLLFTATATPTNATLPVIFEWQATGQTPVTHIVSGTEDTVTFTWPRPGTKRVTVTATNAGNTVAARHTIALVRGVLVEVVADAPAALTATNQDGLTTVVHIPAGAVTETTTLVYNDTEQLQTVPGGLVPTGRFFALTAYRDGQALGKFAFLQPVSITIHYRDEHVAGMIESDLGLYVDEDGWVDAASTCTPASAYQRNLEANTFTVAVCHLSRFAVLGPVEQTSFDIYLPLTLNPDP